MNELAKRDLVAGHERQQYHYRYKTTRSQPVLDSWLSVDNLGPAGRDRVIDSMAQDLSVLDHYTLGMVATVTGLTNSAWISNQLAVNFSRTAIWVCPEFGLGMDTADCAGFQLLVTVLTNQVDASG